MNSRNSNEKLNFMENTKDKKNGLGVSNSNNLNSNTSKNFSLLNVTERKSSYPMGNSNIMSTNHLVNAKDDKIKNLKISTTSNTNKILSPGKNMHRTTKSNFLFEKDNVFSKATETARKLLANDNKNLATFSPDSTTHTQNPSTTTNSINPQINKNVLKIKNFHEATKLNNLPSNSNSARIAYKSEIFSPNVKKTLKK